MRAKSVPVRTLGQETINKLAYRTLIPADLLASKHVLFLEDQPNKGENNSQGYSDRQITMAILSDKPVGFDYVATGSTIKSPDDKPDSSRGTIIALSRATRKL